MEPSLKRSAGLVEDRPSGRMNVMAALIAGVRWTAHGAMMFGHALAQLAVDTFRVQEVPKPFEAGSVIGEHLLKIFVGKPLHLRLLWLFHESRIPEYLPTVKG